MTILTACPPGGPDYQEPNPELPAQWSQISTTVTEEHEAALHKWWTRFKDSALDSLIGRAVAANPDLRLAETRVREARA